MSTTKNPDLCKVVKSEAGKLLSGDVRRDIINLLRDNELTIGETAKKLNMTQQAVYHHMKKLKNAGLVHVTREERCCGGHLIESYYKATAENFVCYDDEPKDKSTKDNLEEILNGLNKIGFKMEFDEEKLLKLAEILATRKRSTKLHSPVPEICKKCGSGDFFLKSGPMDLLKLDHIYHYANLVMMTDEEYEEKVNNEKELRHFLQSICEEKPET
ncbi:MAG: winged helix-turn-helix domain-containing protein [Candidatus Bathyarchaeota archaeon]|nr:winged helix-turn-helix domain-containing protein [Candidatus Bathyarchaeota archaeon]